MELLKIKNELAICKVEDLSEIDYMDDFYFIGKTDEEISLVCSINCIPKNTINFDKTWKAFRVQGVLDFSLIGVISKISTILAENKIGIFAISTYNTDYILTKVENYENAINILLNEGYEITE